MRKLLIFIFLVFFGFSAYAGFGPQNPTSPAGGSTFVAATCTAGTYMFLWDANYDNLPQEACFTNGTATKDGDLVGGSISGDYFIKDAADEHITWEVLLDDGFNEEQGTLWFSVAMSAGDTGDQILEIFKTWNDYIYCRTTSADKIFIQFKGNATLVDITGADALVENGSTFNRVGYSWQVGADAGGKHSVWTSPTGWYEEVEDLDDWASEPDEVTLGDKEYGGGATRTFHIKDFVITSGYQDADPL